ncbi:MAG: sigma-70 family RNA polymerase sigma factor [Opitutae bacterium]|nr:sigma-70 family RNA polymerase sigma factor [Opitutae bacterium]
MYFVSAPLFRPLAFAIPRSPRRPARMTPAAATSERDEQARVHAALLRAMTSGDKSALGRLYDLLAKPLYSLAYRVLHDHPEAQDVVHEVFLQMRDKAGLYETNRGTVFSWAATLTRNRAIDRVRMRKRRAEIIAESAPEIREETPAATGADTLAWQEKSGAVRAALTQLAPDQQAAIELAFFGGLTQQEIAARLNAPLGTVKARIRRGLLKLRETLPAQP